jgi:hypothetical protein
MRPGWKTWAILLLTCILSNALTLVLSSTRSDRNDRKLCVSIASDVEAFLEKPPTTPAGKAQRDSKIELLRTLGCPAEK